MNREITTKKVGRQKKLTNPCPAFWFPISKEHNDNRIKILECALEDLERIKREGEPELPPLTFEEPKIYP